ncbi:MAG: tetratricopeptide repeat protein [Bacteroidales bacterium]|nr:tetratricopeptide repeat protein [Bacteroidales bacterium]
MLTKPKLLIILLFFNLNIFPQEINDLYFKAYSNKEYKNYENAITYYSKAIKNNPNNHLYFIEKGECYYLLNNYNKAINDFHEANKIKPDIADYYIAKCYAKLKNNDTTIIYLEKHLESKYKLYKSQIRLDKDFIEISKTKQWENLWKKDWYNKYENLLADAQYLIKKNKLNDALDIVNDIIDRRTKWHKAYIIRAQIYVYEKNYKLAIEDYNTAIKYRKRNDNYYLYRAKAFYNLGKYKKALSDYSTALKLNQYNLNYYLQKSETEYFLKKYESSLSDINIYITYFNTDDKAISLCGKIHFEMGNYLKALEYFNKAIELNPSEIEYLISRADTYLATKTYKYAEQDYSMILDISPFLGKVYYNRGIARQNLNNTKGACRDWEKARMYKYLDADKYLMKHCVK